LTVNQLANVHPAPLGWHAIAWSAHMAQRCDTTYTGVPTYQSLVSLLNVSKLYLESQNN